MFTKTAAKRNSLQEIRWGVIGSGRIAARFLQDLRCVPGAKAVAIWSRNQQTANGLAQQHALASLSTLEQLLQANLDVIYVATLPDTHAEFSMAAMVHGKAVLCEKPVALNSGELDRVLAVAAERRVLFMEAMKPPFFPLFRELEAQLESRPIGNISLVSSGFCASTELAHPSWQPMSVGGGALLNIGVYHAWLAVYFMGQAQRVACSGHVTAEGTDAFNACMSTHTAGCAQFFSGLDRDLSRGALIVGEHGSIHLPERWWNPTSARIRYASGDEVVLKPEQVCGGLNYEAQHVCELLRDRQVESPWMPHRTSTHVMRLLDAARVELQTSA